MYLRLDAFNGIGRLGRRFAFVTARRARRKGEDHQITVICGEKRRIYPVTPQRRGKGRFSSALLMLGLENFIDDERREIRQKESARNENRSDPPGRRR